MRREIFFSGSALRPRGIGRPPGWRERVRPRCAGRQRVRARLPTGWLIGSPLTSAVAQERRTPLLSFHISPFLHGVARVRPSHRGYLTAARIAPATADASTRWAAYGSALAALVIPLTTPQ